MTNYVYLDLETTGLDQERHEIWEIGAIFRSDVCPTDVEYCWQIRPDLSTADPTGLRIGRYYERLDTTLHHAGPGIARVITHPTFAERYATQDVELAVELTELLDGATVVGAVPWFDERFLQRFLRRHGQVATNHYHLVDVEAYAAGALNMPPPWNFNALLAKWGLKYDEADRHTALGDARMVRDLYDAVTGGGKA